MSIGLCSLENEMKIKKMFLCLIYFFLVNSILYANLIKFTEKEKILLKKIEYVYIDRCDLLSAVAELARQLQIPIAAELGMLSSPPDVPTAREKRDDYRFKVPAEINPQYSVGPFIFKEGTVIEVIDAFCMTMRKDLYWEVRDGLICIYRTRFNHNKFFHFLNKKLPEINFNKESLRSKGSELYSIFNEDSIKGKDVNSIELAPMITGGAYGKYLYTLKNIDNTKITLSVRNSTVRQFFDKLIRTIPDTFYLVMHSKGYMGALGDNDYILVISNYSTPRRELTEEILMEGLVYFSKPPKSNETFAGYPACSNLARDVRSELIRRYKYNPDKFVAQLADSKLIDQWAKEVDKKKFIYRKAFFLSSLSDKRINEMLFKSALSITDIELKEEAIAQLIQTPYDFNPRNRDLLNAWKKIKNDPKNPMQPTGEDVMDYYKEYQEFLIKRIISGRTVNN